MNKLLAVLATAICLIGLTWSTCSAAPYLVSNPYPSTGTQPDYFLVIFDGGAPTQSVPYSVSGGTALHFDLAGIPSGNHTVGVAACSSLWGCSASTPFEFTKKVPADPAGVGISGQ